MKIKINWSFFFNLDVTFILFLIINLFTGVNIVWVISFPPHLLPSSPPHFQAEPVLLLSLILLNNKHKHNKQDKVFLLVELRIAIQRDS
jgi:hypothetical protein